MGYKPTNEGSYLRSRLLLTAASGRCGSRSAWLGDTESGATPPVLPRVWPEEHRFFAPLPPLTGFWEHAQPRVSYLDRALEEELSSTVADAYSAACDPCGWLSTSNPCSSFRPHEVTQNMGFLNPALRCDVRGGSVCRFLIGAAESFPTSSTLVAYT